MSQSEDLLKKIEERNYTVAIIGLGYVELPLMWTFHQNHMPLLGFDIDEKKVGNLKKGIPYIKHLGTEMMEALAKSDIADAILMCVPWTGTKSIEWNKETVSDFDAVLISTNHSSIDYAELAEWSECVIDTRNAINGVEAKNGKHIFKA